MRKFLSTDAASRIIALALSIIVWIYVVLLLDPSIDIKMNDIPVIYTNTVSLTNEGYVLINEKPSSISIKLRGSRAMLAKINKEDITAYIDLNGYNQAGTFSFPMSVRLPYEEIRVVEKKPDSLSVTIDKLITRSLPVTIKTIGTPSDGFAIYESILSQNMIELKGPNDIITSIDLAEVSVDISDMTSDVIATIPIVFYNTNEDVISSKYLTSTPEKIDVRCVILKKKTVPVKIIMNDADQSHTAQVLINSNITIMGKPEIIDKIVEVYSKPLNVSGIKTNTKITLQLDLPNDVVVLDGITDVTAEIGVKTDAH